MSLRNKVIAGALAAGVLSGATACSGTQYRSYPSESYCVDNFGHVEPSYYCDGNGFYGGSHYFLFVGSTHNHTYSTGSTIPRSYITAGKQISPSNTAARKAAGLPVSGSVKNGVTVSKSAKAQPAPKNTTKSGSKVSGSTTKSTTKSSTSSTKVSSGSSKSSSGSSSRSSFGGSSSSRSSFGGSSSSRSSFGSSSSGRK